jgi:tRNA-splicing ligase RtcB (3'-phosphate/5'-hydroxy nucleic acid ligase)
VRVIEPVSGRVPVYAWTEEIEPGAMEQIHNLARLPFAFRYVAIMPDVHQGYGMPIGGVLATDGVIIPNAVGVDIGCGMCAQSLDLREIPKDTLKSIMGRVRELVPVGFEHHKVAQDVTLMPYGDRVSNPDHKQPVCDRQFMAALKQIGTLGGGNHFIEIQAGRTPDEQLDVWVMIHSGSRNLGKQVADHYNKIAVEMNAMWFSSVPKADGLAFLPINSDEGRAYRAEMEYCVAFAKANRSLMMDRVLEAFYEFVPGVKTQSGRLDVAHNYAAYENHYGKNVLVHRKGATRAREGEVVIIPGSQGSKSYIGVGKGNRDSFSSCSHGAGRRMGRRDAQRTLVLEDEIARLDALGVVHGIRNVQDLDEAAGAYKDIESVMQQQQDLVEVTVELTPLGVIKG